MAGPASPGSEGPTFAPPPLPAGWIAQWDGASKKYYFVQLSTGVSQWETPTDAAPVGGTPAQAGDHPFGGPPGTAPQIITHPDGTQTVKHPDGRLEPVMPPSSGDGTRGPADGPAGERGLGVSGKKKEGEERFRFCCRGADSPLFSSSRASRVTCYRANSAAASKAAVGTGRARSATSQDSSWEAAAIRVAAAVVA